MQLGGSLDLVGDRVRLALRDHGQPRGVGLDRLLSRMEEPSQAQQGWEQRRDQREQEQAGSDAHRCVAPQSPFWTVGRVPLADADVHASVHPSLNQERASRLAQPGRDPRGARDHQLREFRFGVPGPRTARRESV